MEQLRKLGTFQWLAKFWEGLTATQRFVTVVFVSTSIVALLFIATLAAKPQMSILFSGLQSDDAGAVVSKLQEKKIPYEVDGTTIKVQDKYIAETRMELASEGLPKGGNVGFELFDKSGLGMTDFTERLNYQRALQGELSRSIDELDGVENSRVHLVIPEHSIYSQEEKPPTASVIVKLRPGSSLNPQQVSGVVHLVASAVEGLKPSDVAIVDTDGNELAEPSDGAGGLNPGMSSAQLQLKRSHEREMEQAIQSMLERVLGPKKAIVRVNAKINFDSEEDSSETYEPLKNNAGVVSNEVQMHESYSGAGDKLASAPVPVNGKAQAGKGDYDRLETTSTYQVSKNVKHIIKAPGQIEKLSVAVMTDGDVSPATKTAITDAVTMAAGIDPARGDQIRVESVKFDNTAEKSNEAEMKALSARDLYLSIGKTVGAALLIFGLFFFAKGMFSKLDLFIPAPAVVHDLAAPATASAAQVVQAYNSGVMPGGVDRVAPPDLQAPPEEIAQVVRKWMSEN